MFCETVFELPNAKINYSGQGTCLIAMPQSIPDGAKLTAVVAVHGSGRGALDYRNTPFYARQKNIALKNGCIFAAVSNVRDTWGTDDGLYNLKLFLDYLVKNYPVREKFVLWSTSAGGTLANRMVIEAPQMVELVIATFPVYDLLSGFSLNSCKTAWKTTDLKLFEKLTQNKNPANFPEKLKEHKFFIAHGSADTAVPILENSLKMQKEVGENIFLEIIENGEHETSNYAYYGKAVEKAFASLIK